MFLNIHNGWLIINRYSDPAFVGSPKFYNCGVVFLITSILCMYDFMVSQDALHKIMPKITNTFNYLLTGFHKKKTSFLFLDL